MAKFESRFNVGDHTWDIDVGVDSNDDYCSYIHEDIVTEVIFGYGEPRYRFKHLNEADEETGEYLSFPESEFFATLDEAVEHVPPDETFYIRCGLTDTKGVRVEIKRS